jgi:hypothetical protein
LLLPAQSCSPILSVWARNVSVPTSAGRRCASTSEVTRKGREMGAQPIQLRRRSTMRWPSDTALDVTAADATKPRQLYRHLAEGYREQMASPVVDVTPTTTRRALAAEPRDLPLARRQSLAARAPPGMSVSVAGRRCEYSAGHHLCLPSRVRLGGALESTGRF